MRAALAAALVAVPALAHAAPLPELIGSPGGSGGFNARVTGASAASTYFNPALLPDAHEDLTLDYFVLGSDLSIDPVARPAGADVGPSIDDGWQRDGSSIKPLAWRPLPTSKLAARQSDGSGSGSESFVGIGLVKRLVDTRLVLGMQILVPAGDFQQEAAFFNDEREQFFGNSLHFEMLGDRLTLPVISFALGGRLPHELSWGVGASLGIATSVTSPVFVPDAGNYGLVYLDNDLSVSSKFSPHLGLAWKPVNNVSVAATVSAPYKVEVIGKNIIRVSDTDQKDQNFHFVNGYEPFGVTLGATWFSGEDGRGLGVVGTVNWRQWSGYEDRHGEEPVRGWKDTFSGSLGVRWVGDLLTLHLDGTYVPSPVPDQVGRSNYVDNDRAGMAAGVTTETSFIGRRVRASLMFEGQRLLARHVAKDLSVEDAVFDEFPDDSVNTSLQPLPEAAGFQSNNPGYPGFASSGWLFGAGVSLETWF